MPELADPPAPTRETVNPGLRALFDVEPPADYPVTTTDDKGTDTVPAKPPEKKEEPTPPAPPEKKAETPPEKATDALKLRLAPDFADEEKKADTPPKPPIKITDEMIESAKTPKAQADMRKFRESYEALEKEVTTLRARPAAPAENPETKTLLETVTKERDDLLARVERTNLLDSPKFQKEHLQPRQKAFDKLQGIVKEGGADPAAIQRAISMAPGKLRIEALDAIREEIGSEMLKGQFDRLVEDIDSKTVEINEKLRNAKVTAEELKRNETVQTHEQRVAQQKQLEGLLGAAMDNLENDFGLEVLKKTGKPEFAWHDGKVDEIKKVAREVYLESTPEKAAMASALAASCGTYRDWWQAERNANKALRDEIAELKGAEPTLSADRRAEKVATDGVEPDDITARLRAGFYKK